jgi:hypothetical protein
MSGIQDTTTRTCKEIKDKIKELHNMSDNHQKPVMLGICLDIVIYTLAIILVLWEWFNNRHEDYNFWCDSYYYPFWYWHAGTVIAFVFFTYIILLIFYYLINAIRKKYDRLKSITLSNALEKVLEILSKPNGIEEFYCQLDKMIINKNRMTKSLMIRIKIKDKIKRDAFIKAFSWVASPD